MPGADTGPTMVIDGCTVVTMDGDRHEYASGHIVIAGNRILAVGAGPAPHYQSSSGESVRVVDGRGCLATPGLVNAHHHLYQWVTRGLAVDETLFGWLQTLYPVWAGIDAEAVNVGAQGALAWLARTGCTTTSDHHYVFPREGGDVFAAEIAAAQAVGLRFHPCRGSMDLGQSDGAAAGPRGRGPRRGVAGDRRGHQPLARPVGRCDGPGRRGTLLPVLRHR